MSKKPCYRCGMCCYVGSCTRGNSAGLWGRCSYLKVNDDLTTSCTNSEAMREMVGLGCLLLNNAHIRKLHEDMYSENLLEFKQTYLKEKNNED